MKKVILFFYLMAPDLALAVDTKSPTSPLTSDYMAKLLLSLGLVVVIIFALAWLVKRFNFIPQQSQGLIKIISTLSVGSRDRLALIQVGDEQLLIALTPGKISKLHRLKTPIDMNEQTSSSFKNKFEALIDKQVKKTPENWAEKNND